MKAGGLAMSDFYKDNLRALKNIISCEHNDLIKVIEMLTPPKSLHQFHAACKNLKILLAAPLPSGLRKELSFGYDFQQRLIKAVEALLEDLEHHRNILPKEIYINESAPVRGLIQEQPIYATLAAYPHDQSPIYTPEIAFLHLLVILMAHYYSGLVKKQIINQKNTSIESAPREIRKILGSKTKKIPDIRAATTTRELLEHLEDWLELHPKQSKDFYGIRLLFESVINQIDRQSPRYQFRFNTRPVRDFKKLSLFDNKDDPDDIDREPVIEVLNLEASPSNEKAIKSKGLHPNEFKSVSSILVYDEYAPLYVKNDERLIRNRNTKKIRSKMNENAQNLDSQWGTPTPYELAKLFTFINDRKFIQQVLPKLTFEQICELQCIPLLIIYTGRQLEDVQGTVIIKNSDTYSETNRNYLAILFEEQQLVLPCQSPANRNLLNCKISRNILSQEPFNYNEPSLQTTITIELPQSTTGLLMELANNITKDRTYKSLNLFKWREQHAKSINDLLQAMNKKAKTRWTIYRLGLVLRGAIYKQIEYQSIINILTRQDMGHAIVSGYYLQLSGEYLAAVIQAAHNWIIDWVSKGIDNISSFEPNIRSLQKNQVIGSSLAVPDAFIHEICAHLKKGISRAAQGPRQDEASLRDTHNALVTYITMWLNLITGYRAVTSPISHPNDLDKQTGLLIISDKDNQYFQHTRLVATTQRFLEQIEAYVNHLNELATPLFTKKDLQRKIFGLVNAYKMYAPIDAKLEIPFLFYLSPTLQVQAVSPKSLSEYSQLSLRTNFNRHYLRSKLTELGAPAECFSYFMGHWAFGEEPYQPYSSISWADITTTILPVIEKIEKLGGWTVQRGLSYD